MSVFVSDPEPKNHHNSVMHQHTEDFQHSSSRSAHILKATLDHFGKGKGLLLTVLVVGLLGALFLLRTNLDNRFLASGTGVDMSLSTANIILPPTTTPFSVFVDVSPNSLQVTALDLKFSITGGIITNIELDSTSPLTTILPETPPDPNRFVIGATCNTSSCSTLSQTSKVAKLTVQPTIPSGQIIINFDTPNTLAASTTSGSSNVAGTLTGLTVSIIPPSPTPLPTPTPPTSPSPIATPTPPASPTPPPTGNNAPIIVSTTLGTALVNKSFTKTVNVSDADGNALTLSFDASTAPGGLSLKNCKQPTSRLSCEFSGIPNKKGDYTVKFTVSDGITTSTKLIPLKVN